jgi:hypothetical protein
MLVCNKINNAYQGCQDRWPKLWLKLVAVAVALLAFTYLLQAPSPLRLNGDSIVLLSMGASAADGHGFLYRGEATHFPTGYPAMVAVLDRLGLASSWSFILLNCGLLGVSLTACYLFCRDPLGLTPSASAGVCCMVMLSFVLVKHMTLPLSDVAFLGLFTPVLLLLARAREGSGYVRWSWLVSAVLLAVVATTVRTAGVALLPAFAWVLGAPLLANLQKLWKERPVVLWSCLVGLLAVGLSCGFLISKTRYFGEMKAVYFHDGLIGRLLENVAVHTREMGEIGFNVPSSKAPSVLKPAYPLVGVLVIGLVFRGIWLRRRSLGVLEVTLLAYGGLIFVWPYSDARFWLPALPLIAGFIALVLIDAARHRYFKFVGVAMCAWFALAGLAALAYSTRISWAGNRFADVYGDGTLSPTYRAAFLGQTNVVADSNAMLLLRRYDPRAQRPAPRNGI